MGAVTGGLCLLRDWLLLRTSQGSAVDGKCKQNGKVRKNAKSIGLSRAAARHESFFSELLGLVALDDVLVDENRNQDRGRD